MSMFSPGQVDFGGSKSRCHTSESCFQAMVGSLCLAVSLQMIARGDYSRLPLMSLYKYKEIDCKHQKVIIIWFLKNIGMKINNK